MEILVMSPLQIADMGFEESEPAEKLEIVDAFCRRVVTLKLPDGFPRWTVQCPEKQIHDRVNEVNNLLC